MASQLALASQLQNSKGAAKLFRAVLNREDERRKDVLAVITDHPERALAALQAGDHALGLTPKGSADVLEEVLSTIPDPEAARTLLEQHLTPLLSN